MSQVENQVIRRAGFQAYVWAAIVLGITVVVIAGLSRSHHQSQMSPSTQSMHSLFQWTYQEVANDVLQSSNAGQDISGLQNRLRVSVEFLARQRMGWNGSEWDYSWIDDYESSATYAFGDMLILVREESSANKPEFFVALQGHEGRSGEHSMMYVKVVPTDDGEPPPFENGLPESCRVLAAFGFR
jgi:hypothetical protein